MLKRVPLNDLFFEVEKSPLRAIINSEMVQPERYKVLHRGTTFLGIKPVQKDRSDMFYMDHSLAYSCARVLAKSIFPKINRHISYANELENKAFIFLGENKDESPEKEEFNDLKPEDLNNRILRNELDEHDQKTLEILHSNGFHPAIAVQNGFDYPDKTIFYLLVELPINLGRSGYLTIAKYKFKDKTIKKILNQPQKKEEYCVSDIKEFGVPSFRKELKEFIRKHQLLSALEATPKQLKAVSLDVFDKNRNLQTLKSDEDLLKKTNKFISAADAFFYDKRNFGFLINFMTTLQVIDFGREEISPTVVNDILTEKKAYKNVKRLYNEKNKDDKERAKYIAEQVRVLDQIPPDE